MSTKIEMEGMKFGKLTVTYQLANNSKGNAMWMCKCDCGNESVAVGSELRYGKRVSCGCQTTKHHLSGTIFMQTWKNMIRRCYSVESSSYHRYGARGICVCEFLRASPANLKLLLGNRPASHSIDRINNNGNYSCGNCAECVEKNWTMNLRWATGRTQCRNKGNNKMIEFESQNLCVSEWSEKTSLSTPLILYRLKKGWSIERALTTPVK